VGASRGAWKPTGALVPDGSTRQFAANGHAGTTDPEEVAIWLNLCKLVVESRALHIEELPEKKHQDNVKA
jgi:hypothetical protein